MHTHYDNLKISPGAPPEVIRAAYRALSHKHHPDRNNGSPESHRKMTIINTAYDVLMDPVKRSRHDAWIFEQERLEKAAALNAQGATRPASTVATASTVLASRSGLARQGAPRASETPKPSPTPRVAPAPKDNSPDYKALSMMILVEIAIYGAISTLADAMHNFQ